MKKPITVQYLLLLLLAAFVFSLVSEKSLRSDSVYFLFQVFDDSWFHHDYPSFRFSNYLIQFPLVVSLNLVPDLSIMTAKNIYNISYNIFIFTFPFYFLFRYYTKNSSYSLAALATFFLVVLPTNNLMLNIANETVLWAMILGEYYFHAESKNWSAKEFVALTFLTMSYETSPIFLAFFWILEIYRFKNTKASLGLGFCALTLALTLTLGNILRLSQVEQNIAMPHMSLFFSSALNFIRYGKNYIYFFPLLVLLCLVLFDAKKLKGLNLNVLLSLSMILYGLALLKEGTAVSFIAAYDLRVWLVPAGLASLLLFRLISKERLLLILLLISSIHTLVDLRASLAHHQAWQSLETLGLVGCVNARDLPSEVKAQLLAGGVSGHSLVHESIARNQTPPTWVVFSSVDTVKTDSKHRCFQRDLPPYAPLGRISTGNILVNKNKTKPEKQL